MSFVFFGIGMKETRVFYDSKEWKACRETFRKSRKGLCEECLKNGIVTAGDMVHHKIHLSPDNMRNPDIALNFDNLELLCRTHHQEKHGSSKRYKVDELGRVIIH